MYKKFWLKYQGKVVKKSLNGRISKIIRWRKLIGIKNKWKREKEQKIRIKLIIRRLRKTKERKENKIEKWEIKTEAEKTSIKLIQTKKYWKNEIDREINVTVKKWKKYERARNFTMWFEYWEI